MKFVPMVTEAVRQARDLRKPIDHQIAYVIADSLKTELWARETGVPPALRTFTQTGQFEITALRSAVGESADDLGLRDDPLCQSIAHALVRYAEFHQDAAGARDAVDNWEELTRQKVSR